jgi:hypothetical protein
MDKEVRKVVYLASQLNKYYWSGKMHAMGPQILCRYTEAQRDNYSFDSELVFVLSIQDGVFDVQI